MTPIIRVRINKKRNKPFKSTRTSLPIKAVSLKPKASYFAPITALRPAASTSL
jgi:hypothetical protein